MLEKLMGLLVLLQFAGAVLVVYVIAHFAIKFW